jgi:hypothetical protein
LRPLTALPACLPCHPFTVLHADKIIAGLSVAQGSKLTGPVADIKLQLDAAKLRALRKALDVLVAALRATPTPSQVRGTLPVCQHTAAL